MVTARVFCAAGQEVGGDCHGQRPLAFDHKAARPRKGPSRLANRGGQEPGAQRAWQCPDHRLSGARNSVGENLVSRRKTCGTHQAGRKVNHALAQIILRHILGQCIDELNVTEPRRAKRAGQIGHPRGRPSVSNLGSARDSLDE